MPGNIQIPDPAGVLPFSLCTKFENSKEWAVLHNQYHDGTQHYGQLATQVSRNTFKLAKKLTQKQLDELKKFYDDHDGPMVPFVFYDVFDIAEGSPIGSNYDADGNETSGQYIVRFGGTGWAQAGGILRTDVPDIQLVEVGL